MSAHQYNDIYDEFGIDLRTLGCVMLGVEAPDTSFIKDEDLYHTNDPKKFWIDGRVQGSHVTLKYGLLPMVKRKHVDRVLEGHPLPIMLNGYGIEMFPSPYPDEPYECIVSLIDTTPQWDEGLMALHNQLNYLPHINTFPDYKPHVTLAYVRKGWYDEQCNDLWHMTNTFVTGELDYGRMQ